MRLLLWALLALAAQTAAEMQRIPQFDNDRVTVWDLPAINGETTAAHKPAGDFVAVTVGPRPAAAFHKKGSAIDPAASSWRRAVHTTGRQRGRRGRSSTARGRAA